MFHNVAGMALGFIATAAAAAGIHRYGYGSVLIAALMLGVFFALYGEEGNDEKVENFRRIGFWAIVIIGDILLVVSLINNLI